MILVSHIPIVIHTSIIKISPLATKIIPQKILLSTIQHTLNVLLAKPLKDNKVDFMENRQTRINVVDLGISFHLTCSSGKLIVSPPAEQSHLEFSAMYLDILLLSTGDVDPDTLFFQRRIKISGDTELGLQVKNFLDTVQAAELFPKVVYAMTKSYLNAQKSCTSMCTSRGKQPMTCLFAEIDRQKAID